MLFLHCKAWAVVDISSETSLEKTDFPLASGYQSWINSCLGLETVSTFSQSWNPVWLEPGKALCMLPQSLCMHMCITLVVSRSSCFLGVNRHLWFTHSFCLLFSMDPEPWREGFGEDTPFRIQCSNVSHALHSVQLWVSLLIPFYWKLWVRWGMNFWDFHLLS